jgi:NhaP-type Na+/H+ or K+/H+ antiporter
MASTAPEPASTEGVVGPQVAILFVGVSLFLGMACRHILHGTRIPYTVALLLLGIGLGGLEYGTTQGLGVLGDSIRMWSNIDPELILFLFLPALLFESSFAMDFHQIKRCFFQMLLLAGPGVLISTFTLGAILVKVFPYDWSWSTGLLLGGLLSATDPVAVVALLKELGASKKLSTLIEGESLMNDG